VPADRDRTDGNDDPHAPDTVPFRPTRRSVCPDPGRGQRAPGPTRPGTTRRPIGPATAPRPTAARGS